MASPTSASRIEGGERVAKPSLFAPTAILGPRTGNALPWVNINTGLIHTVDNPSPPSGSSAHGDPGAR